MDYVQVIFSLVLEFFSTRDTIVSTYERDSHFWKLRQLFLDDIHVEDVLGILVRIAGK
jgi:hypothetical protein